jgi:MoCo/4Fe-4S cofactor protein with predicted Tat translocation signal
MAASDAAEDYWGTIRERLGASGGKRFWRSLEELADTDDFRRHLEAEFPSLAPLLNEASRRDVLRVMGASLALAGLAGCGFPEQEKSVPYVNAPEFLVPGQPRYYATATLLNGYALPVLVRTVDGRISCW